MISPSHSLFTFRCWGGSYKRNGLLPVRTSQQEDATTQDAHARLSKRTSQRVEDQATHANRSNALELICRRERESHEREQEEGRALQLRVGKCVSYLRAHVLFEVAGLKRQVREMEKSVEELMSTSILQDQQQVIRLLENKVSEQDAQWAIDVDILKKKLKAAAFEGHQLQCTLVAAQASLERSMAETIAAKKTINILESSITDLVGQRDEQQQALCKSQLALQALNENCSKLNEAVMQGERRLARTRAERNALQDQVRQLSAVQGELGATVSRHKTQVNDLSAALCRQEVALAASDNGCRREKWLQKQARQECDAIKFLVKTDLAAFKCELSQLQDALRLYCRLSPGAANSL